MEAIRIDLRAYTASFRVPGMMGYQITSPVPPPATIYGLLAAASGREVTPEETWIAYRFEYEALAQDLEKIVGFFEGGPKWDKKLNAVNTAPITRQFLYRPLLVLYLKPGQAAESFRRPRFPLVIGRSQDVAYVDNYKPVLMQPAEPGAKTNGVLLPFPMQRVRSRIMSLPTYFELATRRALAVKPFHVLDSAHPAQAVQGSSLLYQETRTEEVLAVPLYDRSRLMP